jgi:hypothetical protein
VHHLPPGISKWHKIAPRLFSYISQNWRATPPVSYRVIVGLISATTTKTGLAVHCELDGTTYSKGITVSDEEMDTINITRADFHSEWNYIIRPGDRSDRAADSSQALKAELQDFSGMIRGLSSHHPISDVSKHAKDFAHRDELADALLHPRDRPVPQIHDCLRRCGTSFGRWHEQAPIFRNVG